MRCFNGITDSMAMSLSKLLEMVMDCNPSGSLSMEFQGKNTGVGCHLLHQGIFPAQGSNQHFLHLPAMRETLFHMGSIPGSRRSPGEEVGNLLQCSCLENPMDRGAWWATNHGVTKELDVTDGLKQQQ